MVILHQKSKINLAKLDLSFSQIDANFEIKSIKIWHKPIKKSEFKSAF